MNEGRDGVKERGIAEVVFLVEQIVPLLVDKPEEIIVCRAGDSTATVIALQVSQYDLRQLLGEKRHMTRSLRTLLRMFGAKLGHSFVLELSGSGAP